MPTGFPGTESCSGDGQKASKTLPELEVSCGLKAPSACLGDGGQVPVAALDWGFGRAKRRRDARVNLGPRARRKEKIFSAFVLR